MSRVSVVNCEDYSQAVGKTRKALDEVRAGKLVRKGDLVLLKVNLILGAPPEKAVNTHPEIVKGVGIYFKELGCKIVVADSSGTKGFTSEAFRISGIKSVCDEEGFALLNFEKSKLKKTKINGKLLKELYLPKDVLNADLVVSMPKLKTHVFTKFTGSIKNFMGVVPGDHKKKIHRMGKNEEKFAHAMVDLLKYLKPGLSVMDAVLGMEGNGPTNGKPKKLGYVICGKDLVAVDAVSSYLMGFNAKEIPITRIAYERGLGEMRIKKIKTDMNLDSIRKKFRKPKTMHTFLKIYNYTQGYHDKLAKPVIGKNCRKCMICYESCPVNAISVDNKGFPKINYTLCIKCYCCHEKCQYGNVKIAFPPLIKTLFKKKHEGYELKELR